MPRICIYCKKDRSEGRTLHGFPLHDAAQLKIWKERLNLHASFSPTKYTKICSDHFSGQCFNLIKTGRVLIPGSLPSFFSKRKMGCFYCNSIRQTKPGISLHRFPLNKPELLKLWLQQINMENFVPDKDSYICSDHFEKSCFRRVQNRKCFTLKEEALPSIFVKETLEDTKEPKLEEAINNNDKGLLKLVSNDFLFESTDLTESEDECVETIDRIPTEDECDEIIDSYPIEDECDEAIDPNPTEDECDELIDSYHTEDECDETINPNPTQDITDPFGCAECVALKAEIDALRLEKNKIETELKRRIQTLELEVKQNNIQSTNMSNKLGSFFTQNQIEMLWSPTTTQQQRWLEIDVVKSINLYSVSPTAYNFLKKNNFPLPPIKILKRWIQTIKLCPGFLKPVAQVLKTMTNMDENEKVCVLSFDEMKITASPPFDYVHVAMLTGLMSKWEQPIFYSFKSTMNVEILNNILATVEDCGFTIVAIVSGLGGANTGLFMELKLSPEKPWFLYKNKKIFVFPDVPHLLELLVKFFFDHGFLIKGKEVKKNIVSELLSCTPPFDQNLSQQINSSDHLNVSGAEHKKAATHFSQSIAKVISRAANLGLLKEANWKECYKLFKLTGDWFDIMNVSTPASYSGESIPAYGQALSTQNPILDNMSKLMASMRVIGKTNVLPFQKGIAHSNVALRLLLRDLAQRFGFKYVLTNRLHKSALDNTLDLLGTKGGLQKLPNPNEFRSRLTSHILGHNEIVIPDNLYGGCDTSVVQAPLTALIFKNIIEPVEEENIFKIEVEEESIECDSPKLLGENTDMPKAKKLCISQRM